jgi:hypothetical protein
MVRASRYWPDIYFGRPGAMTKLPWPRGGVDRPYEKLVADFVTGSGHHLVTSTPSGSRLLTLNWNALHQDNYGLLAQYWYGAIGIGPWALADPSVSNMLLPNQGSTTSHLYDTTGFKTSDGLAASGSLLSGTSLIQRTGAPRSLQWSFPVTAGTTPTLLLNAPYRNWYGYPVVQNLSYAWSCYLAPDGVVDSSITASVRLRWLDASGGFISEATSTTTAVTTWTLLSAIGTPPSNAVYCQPAILLTGATITTGGSLFLDSMQLEQDTVVNPWAPGSGMRAVEITSLTDTVPFDAKWRAPITMVLRELVS